MVREAMQNSGKVYFNQNKRARERSDNPAPVTKKRRSSKDGRFLFYIYLSRAVRIITVKILKVV